MTTIFEKISALEIPSEREKEIADRRKRDKSEIRELNDLRQNRIEARNLLIKEGWEKLKALGYEKYKSVSNPAYDSGHSDYVEPSGNVVFWGVQAPDGTQFAGHVSWTEGIIPAIEHAGI
jgi:hypothetical protein